VLIAIGNAGDPALAGSAVHLIDDPSALVRGMAVWAAARLLPRPGEFSSGRITATAPRTRRDPAWIVAEGQGEMVVWDDAGTRLAAVTMKDARPLGVIDWPDGRYVLAGGPALRAVALDGRVVFDWTVPEMTVAQALPLTLEAGVPPAVALLATGPANGWRLQIVSRDKTLVYDERLGAPTTLLKAQAADGVDRLFLRRAGLLALRRRAS